MKPKRMTKSEAGTKGGKQRSKRKTAAARRNAALPRPRDNPMPEPYWPKAKRKGVVA